MAATKSIKRTTTKHSRPGDMAEAPRTLARSVERVYVGLERCSASSGRPVKPTARIWHKAQIAVDRESNHILVMTDFILRDVETIEELANQPTGGELMVAATYKQIFRILDRFALSDAILQEFAKTHARREVWPLWQELCASLLVRMNSPQVTFPAADTDATSWQLPAREH